MYKTVSLQTTGPWDTTCKPSCAARGKLILLQQKQTSTQIQKGFKAHLGAALAGPVPTAAFVERHAKHEPIDVTTELIIFRCACHTGAESAKQALTAGAYALSFAAETYRPLAMHEPCYLPSDVTLADRLAASTGGRIASPAGLFASLASRTAAAYPPTHPAPRRSICSS